MPAYFMKDLTRQGVYAARAGNKTQALQLLTAAVKSDEADIVAWWWLAQIIDDPKARHKCLEKAQMVAAESVEGGKLYKELLRESGAPNLSRLKLARNSKSVGDRCPICSADMVVGDEVVTCPECHRSSHRECWEDNVFHCGNFACSGSALVDSAGGVQTESAAKAQTIKVEHSEIPDETPWASRETQEAGFIGRLKRQAAEALAERAMRQMLIEGLLDMARRAQEEEIRRAMARRAKKAFFLGLLVGIPLAVLTFRYSQSWLMALFTIYLAASAMSVATAYSFIDSKPVVNFLYWLLPQVIATLLMWGTFDRWGTSVAATALGAIVVPVVGRILRTRLFYYRRGLVTYSFWLLLGLMLIRRFI